MSDFILASIKASQQIIEILSQAKPEYMQKHQIGAGGDISLEADLICEKIFAQYLLPIASIDSEESGYINGNGKDIIILDPLDGSDNYASGIPYYGASIALCDENLQTKEAIIINFCSQNAYFNSGNELKCVRISDCLAMPTLQNPNLVKCGIFEKAYSNPNLATKFFDKKIKFRSLGAVALSLAYAHQVNFVLFAGKIRKYDCQAGLFLCRDLWVESSEEFLLVSRNKQIFDMITQIAKKD